MGVLSPHDSSTTYLQELRDPDGLSSNVGIYLAERRILHRPVDRHQALLA